MYAIDGMIRGLQPFLYNRYTDKIRPGKLRKEELIEEATRRVYRDEAGVLILPPWNLLRCFLDGARLAEVKHGRKSIGQYLLALMMVEASPSFGVKEFKIREDLGRVPPRTGPMVILYRPQLDPGWVLSFRAQIADSSTLPPETMHEIVKRAGILAGIGAWRPYFGRFVIESFSVQTIADDGAAAAPLPAAAAKPTKRAKKAA